MKRTAEIWISWRFGVQCLQLSRVSLTRCDAVAIISGEPDIVPKQATVVFQDDHITALAADAASLVGYAVTWQDGLDHYK
jgi:hypothetical protein